MIRFFFNLIRGHFRKHRLEALLCLAGVALGVAVVVAIDAAVAACVSSFSGAVDTLAQRSTHSIFAEAGTLSDTDYIALVRKHPPVPLAPVIDRGVLIERARGTDDAQGWSDNDAQVGRLVGVDVFSESAMRSFTQMQSALDHSAFERFMTEPGQVVLAAPLARRLGVKAGDPLRITAGAGRRSATVTGVIELTGVARAQMANLIVADLSTAQELTGLIGRLDRIDVKLDSPDQQRQLAAMLHPGLKLLSTQQQATNFANLIGSYRMNLSALSLMAAFVAIFIVYNSMLISVHQRLPALGILRCLGASRWQLGGMYLIEAVMFAIIGGALGVVGGWGLSRLLVGFIATTINDLYASIRPAPVTLEKGEILKGFAVALGSCLIGAAVPLFQASRTPPINAFNSRSTRSSVRVSVLLLVASAIAGSAAIGVYYLPGNSPFAGFVMALLVAVGFALLCPAITRAACRCVEAIARPAQWLPMQMAAAGVGRTLGITGVAVAAMMLAMAMNVGVRTMTSSFRSALDVWINRRFDADVFLAPELLVNHHIDATLDPAIEKWARAQPQFASAVATRVTDTLVRGESTALVGADIAPMLGDGTLPFKSSIGGAFDAQRDALISEPLAGRAKLRVGDWVTLDSPGGARQFRVFGIFYEFGNEHGEFMIDRRVYARLWNDPLITTLHVRLRPGYDAGATAALWAEKLRPRYPVAVNSFADIRAEILTVFDRTFKVTEVLSWLAGGVAFCGLAGALLALALARQRDYSVLAAIGMSGRQTGEWLLAQGFLIAWISAAVAAVAGTALAYVLAYVIQYRSFGWSIPTHPWPRYFGEDFLLATAAAIVAMIYPALRLRRSPPAGSLREE